MFKTQFLLCTVLRFLECFLSQPSLLGRSKRRAQRARHTAASPPHRRAPAAPLPNMAARPGERGACADRPVCEGLRARGPCVLGGRGRPVPWAVWKAGRCEERGACEAPGAAGRVPKRYCGEVVGKVCKDLALNRNLHTAKQVDTVTSPAGTSCASSEALHLSSHITILIPPHVNGNRGIECQKFAARVGRVTSQTCLLKL